MQCCHILLCKKRISWHGSDEGSNLKGLPPLLGETVTLNFGGYLHNVNENWIVLRMIRIMERILLVINYVCFCAHTGSRWYIHCLKIIIINYTYKELNTAFQSIVWKVVSIFINYNLVGTT